MAYATAADMIARFGETEMIRLSATGDMLPSVPDAARIGVALDDATAVIESYLRQRYALPLNPVPREILRCCCILARFDMAQGGDKVPSDEMTKAREAELTWLADMGSSEGRLDALPARAASGARVRDRARLIDGLALP